MVSRLQGSHTNQAISWRNNRCYIAIIIVLIAQFRSRRAAISGSVQWKLVLDNFDIAALSAPSLLFGRRRASVLELGER